MRKGMIALLLTAALSALSAGSVLAGTWTTVSPEGQTTGKKYYIGDSGVYMKNCWVQVDAVWYWLMADGSLPTAYGISTDGYIFNDQGVYVPSITGNAQQAGSGRVQGVSGSSSAYVSSTSVNGSSYTRSYYRTSDYGPGAGGVSDPHTTSDERWEDNRGPGRRR